MKKVVLSVVLLSLFVVAFAKPVDSHNRFTIPTPGSVAPDLVAQISAAKSAGDVLRVQELQSRLDALSGVVRQPALASSVRVEQIDYLPRRADGKSFGTDGYVSGTSNFEGAPAVAVSSDGTIFVAYVARVDDQPHKVIAVAKSTDGGSSWTGIARIVNPDGDLHYPDIAIGEGVQDWIFVSYHTSGNDVQVARCSFSGSGGESHSVDGAAFTGKYKARITVDSDPYYYVYVAYISNSIFDTDVHFAKSTDFGVTWSPMDFTSTGTDYCDIAALSGGKIAIVTQTSSGETGALWCAISSDYGASWSGSNIASSGFQPRIAANGDDAVVVYAYRFSDSDHDIKFVRTTDGGSSWSDGFVDASYLNEKFPDVTAGETGFMAAYWEQGKIKFASLNYDEEYWGGRIDVSDEATAAETYPAVAVSNEAPGGCPVVVWEEAYSAEDHDVRFDKNCCEEISPNLYAFPVEGTAPLEVTFKNQSTGSVDNFVIYFGDGDSSLADSVVHTYTEPGTYTAMLVVSNFCYTETVTVDINVGCPDPVAGIWVSPSMGTAPLTVYFTDTSTGYIVSRRWDFGDGSSDTAAITSHTYTTEGMYNVSLVVYDPCGNSDTAFASIWVYSPTGAQLSVSPDPMEFGEVPVGECASAHLILSNTGDDTLRIDSIKTDGSDYTVIFSAPMFLAPDGTDSVEVRFCPSDTGDIAGRITIFSNDSHSPIKSVALSGVGTASPMMNLSVTPEVLLFDSVATDECQTKRITVRNNGDTPIAVTGLTLVGSGAFTITGHDTFTVDPGSYRYITIRFCPYSSSTEYSGTLFVHTEVGEYTVILLGNVYEELTCVDYGSYEICSNHIDGNRIYGNIRFVNSEGDTIARIGSVGDLGAYIDLDLGAGTGVARFVHEDGSMPYVYGGAFDLTYYGIRFRFDPSTSMLPDSIRDRITPDSLLGAPFSYTASLDPAYIDIDDGYWEISGEITINNGPNFIGGIGVHRRSYYDGEVQWFIDDFQIGLWNNAFQFKFRDAYVSGDTIEAGRIYLKVNSSLIPSNTFIDGGYFEIDARSLAIYHGELVDLDLAITFPDFVFPAGGHTVGIRRARMRLVWEDGMITRFSGGGRLSISGLMPDLGGETYIGAYVTIIRDVGMDDVRLEFMGWSPGIPLGTTGFFLTGVFGEVRHITDPDNLFIQFGCQLSGGPSVPYFGSVVRMEPQVTIDFAEDMFALEGTVRFLEHLARGSGGFRYWWNYGGGGWALMGYANLRTGITDNIWAQGGTELSMWREPAGRFHLAGATEAEVHIRHHAIAWLFPTHDIEVDGALYYGEFRHGGDSGGHWGVKGEAYLNFLGLRPTFAYIDGHLSLMGDARSYTPMEMYRRFYKSTVEEDLAYNIGNTDVNLFIVRTDEDITPNISVETPDGHLITLDSCSFDEDAELVRVEGYYDGNFYRGIVVKRNIPGIWTVHLSDIPAGDSDHPVQVKGFYRPMEIALSTEVNSDGFHITGGVDGVNPEDTVYLTLMLKPLDIQAGPEPIAELALAGDEAVDQNFAFEDLGFVEGDYILMAYAEDKYNRFAQFVDSATVIHFPEDTIPPSAPEFAIASWVDDEDIRLVWKRVNEPDIAGYKVYKGWDNGDGTYDWWEENDVAGANYFLFDNAKVMIPESLRTAFVFGISAYDNSGNEGETLIVVPGGVDPADRDTIPPAVAFDYATPNLAERTLDVAWTGEGGVYEYLFRVANTDGDVFLQTEIPGDVHEYVVDKLMPGADYMLIITAVDSALNLSAPDTIYVGFYDVADQDADGIPDWWENFYFDSPNECNPADDPDGDLVSNRDEYAAGTNPNSIDSDNDGVSDLSELASPLLDPNSDADDNGNRIADDWEIYFFGSDTIPDIASGDPDGDGLTNLEEYENRTDPHSYDTDGGGLTDGEEVALGTNPNDPTDDDNVVCTIHLNHGWNMVALPVTPPTTDWEQLLPTAVAVFEYDNSTGAYYPVDEIEPGRGYWVYSNQDVDVDIAGAPVFTVHTEFTRGWVMLGGPMYPDGYPITAIQTVPDGLLIPPVFTYDGSDYVESSVLEPGRAYWVFLNGDGTLTMDRAYAALGRVFSGGDYAAGSPPPPPSLDDNVVLPNKLVVNVAPTPFNASTNVSLGLTGETPVSVDVFDLNGHLIRNLYRGVLEAGFHNFVWDATDNSGAELPTGVYLIHISAGEHSVIKKAVLVR